MSEKPKILCIGDITLVNQHLPIQLAESFDFVSADSCSEDIESAIGPQMQAIVLDPESFESLLSDHRILNAMPEGVALVSTDAKVLWSNSSLSNSFDVNSLVDRQLDELFEIKLEGPFSSDFSPIRSAIASNSTRCLTLPCENNRVFKLDLVPLNRPGKDSCVIVMVREVTVEVQQQQKLTAIHKAGTELADLTAEEVFQMEVEERIELLKSNILHFSRDILDFDVVEIRLLGRETGELMPLLSVGIQDEAAKRPLFAQETDYGVTGFVAATGKSYHCIDTTKDPLYIEGFKGAKSSLTVPLILHDQVIGTFNVESPEPEAFDDQDLQFLEIFSRDVANALNTLELLVAQHTNTAQASVELIHRRVALPVDEILNDAVNVMENYIGHDRSVVERLRRILQNARDIKQLIYTVGQEMAPAEAVPAFAQPVERPNLRDRRILVVDNDEDVRIAAHSLLEQFDCVVETAHGGDEAMYMVRNSDGERGYDAVISDIHLSDMSGYDLMLKLKEIMDPAPLILMTGFGYDPDHTIVRARQAGLHPHAILYKPFRLDQLLEVVEGVIMGHDNIQKV